MKVRVGSRRAHDKLVALPGVRTVRRPVSPGSAQEFDLYYVRTGRKSPHPLLIIPGGPGAASIALYRGTRRRAAAAGLDVIMVEHRGVGLSRHDDTGADLPPAALTINQVVDDIAAVLDDAHVERAIPYGTSYGTYIAAGLGVRHPQRMHAMILDSPVLSGDDIDEVRKAIRAVLWDGTGTEGDKRTREERTATVDLAPKVRKLVDDGVLTPAAGQLAAAVYGFGGPTLLNRQLDLLLRGRRGLWTVMDGLARRIIARKAPYRHEPDLVGRIGFRELNYGDVPDGKPLDPAAAYREFSLETVEFEAEPYDLVAEMPKFSWPTAVVSGGRDLTTPPAIADRIASLIPAARLVRLATCGHSVLDSREPAALQIAKAVSAGQIDTLPARALALDALPASAPIRMMTTAISLAAAIESVLPVPRRYLMNPTAL
ncbi:MAG TPA: alpha/beta fold hydrolase [Mycobacterium sp.]|jgi:pimeloyl-ACP methyl ester carboxylesterase